MLSYTDVHFDWYSLRMALFEYWIGYFFHSWKTSQQIINTNTCLLFYPDTAMFKNRFLSKSAFVSCLYIQNAHNLCGFYTSLRNNLHFPLISSFIPTNFKRNQKNSCEILFQASKSTAHCVTTSFDIRNIYIDIGL